MEAADKDVLKWKSQELNYQKFMRLWARITIVKLRLNHQIRTVKISGLGITEV